MARHERCFDHAHPVAARAARGRMAYLAGLAAEEIVVRAYLAAGYELLAERWRGRRGEIDLVFSTCLGVVMVEVKASKSFESAAAHLTPAQVSRLYATADEYLATLPNGSLTDVRFDVALVDQAGGLNILENAFAGCI
ncbi:YraN family protein [Tateyamaria omphalii]|uniref:YraN family protein n=1 Tax=Tateyamaria omphalii TaxID=299262 RepID=UPI001C9920F5|nr:YraN family protein [Tateyamaria omphalii]MBY5934846.1 YraN family protein [Tateyamaria omphalii]